MTLRRWWVGFAALLVTCVWLSVASAQSPSVIYTWDHSFGEAVGANLEGWVFNHGNNTVTLDNLVDGTMTITETGTAGEFWALRDSFNRIKESFNPNDYGGLDLTGLSALEIEIGHNGPNPVPVRFFSHATALSTNVSLGPDVMVNPGMATYSVPLTGLTPLEISSMRTLGIESRPHLADGNLTWLVNEIRSVGTPLEERIIANHDGGAGDLDGAIVNTDEGAVVGHSAGQNNTGLTVSSSGGVNSLQWDETAGGDGAAISWGNGNDLYSLIEFAGRPMDASNYRFADVRVRVASSVANEDVSVQYYMQTRGYTYYAAGPDQIIPADGNYHELSFPLGGIPNRGEVQLHGLNFGSHVGATRYRVDYVIYRIPEPAGAVLLMLGLAGLCIQRRNRR